MKIALLVNAAPTTEAAYTAYTFAKTALVKGHTVTQVFFYQDGVYVASHLAFMPQDELSLNALWAELAQQYSVPLMVCVAAGLRRGLLSADAAMNYEKPSYNVVAPFQTAGLGQWLEAMTTADRFITFNP